MTERNERFQALYRDTLPQFIERPHIVVGCGAIGGVICQTLGQIGVRTVHLWDHDTIEEVNLGPQGFPQDSDGCTKVMIRDIQIMKLSKMTTIHRHPSRFKRRFKHPEHAYWWLMVDDLDVRELIYETAIAFSPTKIIDARMGGLGYEVYCPDVLSQTRYLNTLQYARDNPVQEGCTTRSTPHCAMIAGALAVNMALSPAPPFCVKGDLLSYNQEVIY